MRALLLLLLLTLSVSAQQTQRRIVRLESRIYGWYAIADPSFDKTIGRRELYKVSGQDKFLKGLAGRLVLIEGVFSEGSLHLPALAAPPISLPEDAVRRVFLSSLSSAGPPYKSESDFTLQDPDSLLALYRPGRWKLDLIVEGSSPELQVVRVVSAEEVETRPSTLVGQGSLDAPAQLDVTLTQDFLDLVTALGLKQADVSATYQGLTLRLTDLYIKLPQQVSSESAAWSLQGSVGLSFGRGSSLAETSFVVDAEPLIEDNVLKLKPDWQNIRVEGQLPFSFALGTKQLGSYARYLPEKITLLDLVYVTAQLRNQRLLSQEGNPVWFLGRPSPQTVRIALGDPTQELPAHETLQPGAFRLILGQQLVDRLIKKEIDRMLSPEKPYLPEPPIEVGKALFIPILVKKIYIRDLQAGYRQSVFRFDNLTIDVGWEAGPLSGTEPLLTTSGYVRPKLSGEQGKRFWDWDLVLENLIVRSDKIPGNKNQLATEFKPQIEQTLGRKLAAEKRFSNRIPLSRFLGQTDAVLEITRLRALDATLTLEGRVNPNP